MKKRVAVLGATGSIGKSTLDILRTEKDRFEPVLFSAHKNREGLLKLKEEFPRAATVLADDSAGLLHAIESAGADITVNGISGAAGLEPSVAVLKAGSDLALANKETIVMAGSMVIALAREKKLKIIPVDSEHYAVFRLLEAHGKDNAEEIILTASGGPFRNYSMEKLKNVTLKEALAHPTWSMGPKITVDSATMANKGLEVIEATGLFGFPPEKIKVTVHPQSTIHSMVRLNDGAFYAQLSKPDMRLPILGALCWPESGRSALGALDFDSLELSFEKPDLKKFPMLALAYEALKGGKWLPTVYNAANEVAVGAFFDMKISFLEIPCIVEYVLNRNLSLNYEADTIEDILKLDREARKMTMDYIENRSGKC